MPPPNPNPGPNPDPDPKPISDPKPNPNPNPNQEQACLGGLGRVTDLCRTSHFLNTKGVGPASGKNTLVREAERNGFVNDFFFIAPSRTADTWAAATPPYRAAPPYRATPPHRAATPYRATPP